jgi:hypothetical protein
LAPARKTRGVVIRIARQGGKGIISAKVGPNGSSSNLFLGKGIPMECKARRAHSDPSAR